MPLQHSAPLWHPLVPDGMQVTQLLPAQNSFVGQTFPHMLQFCESLLVSTQVPVQGT